MKATLEFDLPDDKSLFEHATKGLDYYICLSDLDERIRVYLKHSDNYDNAEEFLISLRQDLGKLLWID